MGETITWLQKLSNRIYGIPAVAQWWARRAAQRSASLDVDDEAIPFARLRKPLSTARGVLMTTGGVHLIEQTPFDMETPQVTPIADSGNATPATHHYAQLRPPRRRRRPQRDFSAGALAGVGGTEGHRRRRGITGSCTSTANCDDVDAAHRRKSRRSWADWRRFCLATFA
jgi:hypothetical protein